MFEFVGLNDGTIIFHSKPFTEDGVERVRVAVERINDSDIQSALMCLPIYEWVDSDGFTSEELDYFNDLIQRTAHIIYDLARTGGIDHNAAAV